ncbi:MAG: DUF3703 domain-containing protein [Sphingopyxis sp.]|jgi:hypothetical protein|uniref:DUF3703 domain-containing protein n=1 Tax=Sphingopyxis sp. TaxID=1908224 RepID=UPI002ABCED8D|nr:DUF3703 domain-containing protein [Sphingopyxis sp.]MDZ3831974.1 DUF3703 domain-containing protein [Sphingopyxis sp.]
MAATIETMLPRAAADPILHEQRRAFADARRIGDSAAAWKALEWEHIVAQPYMDAHLASHWRMLGYAVSQGDWRESGGQAFRLMLVPLGSLTGRLPIGNSGRARISAFRNMAIPDALAARIEQARVDTDLHGDRAN